MRRKKPKFFFFPTYLYLLIAVSCAICAYRVQSGLCLPSWVLVQLSNNGRVRIVHLRHFLGLHRFGSHFQLKSGSVPCSTIMGLFGYEFFARDCGAMVHSPKRG